MIIKEKPRVIPKQPMANILVIWLMEYLMNSSKMESQLGIGWLVTLYRMQTRDRKGQQELHIHNYHFLMRVVESSRIGFLHLAEGSRRERPSDRIRVWGAGPGESSPSRIPAFGGRKPGESRLHVRTPVPGYAQGIRRPSEHDALASNSIGSTGPLEFVPRALRDQRN